MSALPEGLQIAVPEVAWNLLVSGASSCCTTPLVHYVLRVEYFFCEGGSKWQGRMQTVSSSPGEWETGDGEMGRKNGWFSPE